MTENYQLELAPSELVIPLKVTLGNAVYRVRHRLRPPAAEDWYAYDAALAMAIEEVPVRAEASVDAAAASANDGATPGYKLELRSIEAAALLWDRLARGIEGYRFAADAAWHELVPLAHKEAAIHALTLVAPVNYTMPAENPTPSPGAPLSRDESRDAWGEFPLQADQIPVVLEAIVAGRAYPRLVHIFRPPSAEDERSYRRLLAETLLVRGSRTTRTLIPARLRALCRLYDRLILSVEGYSIQGQPLASRDQLLQYMDAWHKRTAVQALFGDAQTNEGVPAALEESQR